MWSDENRRYHHLTPGAKGPSVAASRIEEVEMDVMSEITTAAGVLIPVRPRVSIPPHLGQVCLPPTQEEIARASEDAFRIFWSLGIVDFEAAAYLEFLLARDSTLRFCPCECAFAEDVVGCMRRLRLSRLRCRPRARARRRRHSSGRSERGPPPDDDGGGGGDGDGPPRARKSSRFSGRRS